VPCIARRRSTYCDDGCVFSDRLPVEEVLRLPAEAELVASWGRPPPGDGAAGGSNLVGIRLSSFRHMAFDLLYAPSTLLPTGCPRLARSQSPVPRTAPPCCRSNNALFDPVARSCWPGAASRSLVYVPYAVTLSVLYLTLTHACSRYACSVSAAMRSLSHRG
jgi:hypothetical protein